MPARVYSTRFLAGRTSGSNQSLTVPPNMRAVVRFASIVPFGPTVDYCVLNVNAVPIAWLLQPTDNAVKYFDLRAIAYEGETINWVHDGGDCAWHVSGFLFTDV